MIFSYIKRFFNPCVFRYFFFFTLLCLMTLQVQAGSVETPKEPIIFTDPQVEKDYLQLAKELRCLVCQNQNLIDSNADLADDLRREVAKMLKQGKSKDQVTQFMVDRYGDFVLYNPPFKTQTWLLWGGPFVLMFFAIYWLLKKIKVDAKEANTDSAELSEKEKERLANILNKK